MATLNKPSRHFKIKALILNSKIVFLYIKIKNEVLLISLYGDRLNIFLNEHFPLNGSCKDYVCELHDNVNRDMNFLVCLSQIKTQNKIWKRKPNSKFTWVAYFRTLNRLCLAKRYCKLNFHLAKNFPIPNLLNKVLIDKIRSQLELANAKYVSLV